jgi:hypothetical protein
MIEDEVMRDVRAAREAFAASHGYDIRAMVAALSQPDIVRGWTVVRLAPQPATPSGLVGPHPVPPPAETPTTGSLDR